MVGCIEFQTAVLARDARIIVGLGGLGDYPIGLDQSQKKDHRYDYVSHIAALQLGVAGVVGHSLRSGLVTTAVKRGLNLMKVCETS